MKRRIGRYLKVIVGLFIVSFAFNLFLLPNGLAAIGISGLALIFEDLYKIDISLFVLISNLLLITLSFCILGKKSTTLTIIGSILSPIFLKVTLPLTHFFDLSNTELIVQALFAGLISGIGYGLIFKQGYTSGGTDILDQIISKVYKVPIGTSIILVDGLIVILGGLAFGVEKMAYSIIVLLLISIYSNKALIGINSNKAFYIYTRKPKEVKEYLIKTIKNDVTILKGNGGYTNRKVKILLSVMSSNEYYCARSGILAIDPNAFLIINNSYESINSNQNFTTK